MPSRRSSASSPDRDRRPGRRIRAEAPATAVVVLTGSSYAEDVEKAYAARASGYVTKDRISQDLVRTVLDAVT